MTSPSTPPPADPSAPAPGQMPPQGSPPAGQAGWQPGWEQRHHHDHDHDERRGAIVGGVFLVLLGLAFLAQELIPDLDIGRFWPVILVVIGGALILSSIRRSA